jgi:flagellar secretion chaperone FliS
MISAYGNRSQAYKDVGVETSVMSANPHRLVLMLFDGALVAVAQAKGHLEQRDVPGKCAAITKAIAIISEGLRASLDIQAGGELAARLDALYEYMAMRLLAANAHNDATVLEEVRSLLLELRGAWEEIANDPAVLSANRGQAG